MIALFGLLLVAYATDGLGLKIESPQEVVLVGEPFKLIVHWSATKDLRSVAIEEQPFAWQSLALVADGPNGRHEYRERSRDGSEAIRMPRRLGRGDRVVTTLVFYDGRDASDGHRSFLFPTAGTYRLWAVYTAGDRPVESNAISVTARMPDTAEDKAILTLIARDRRVLDRAGHAPAPGNRGNPYALLLKQYPLSPYLRYARLWRLGDHQGSLGQVYDPETHEPVYDVAHGPLLEFQARHYRELAQQVLADDTWGPFEEEALHAACTFAWRAGARELEEEARARLLEKYPESSSAEAVRRREDEREPKH